MPTDITPTPFRAARNFALRAVAWSLGLFGLLRMFIRRDLADHRSELEPVAGAGRHDHPQGRIGAIEEGINRVPHDLGILLRRHGLQVFSKPRIALDALRDKGSKAVIPVKGGHHRLHTLVEGYVQAPVELRRQVRVTDNATGDVGREDSPDAIRVTRGAPQGDGGTEGATTQVRLVQAQGVHEPHDILTDLVPGLHHHWAL